MSLLLITIAFVNAVLAAIYVGSGDHAFATLCALVCIISAIRSLA